MTEEQQLIQYFLGVLGQIKLFHWSTMQYNVHKALDDLHGSLSDKVDTIVESYIGRTKKQPLRTFVIENSATTDCSKLDKFLEKERDEVLKLSNKMAKYPEIVNVMEEIVSDFNKAIYLCKLAA